MATADGIGHLGICVVPHVREDGWARCSGHRRSVATPTTRAVYADAACGGPLCRDGARHSSSDQERKREDRRDSHVLSVIQRTETSQTRCRREVPDGPVTSSVTTKSPPRVYACCGFCSVAAAV